MIAAGEVVQRPASVVKELVENAIDAGASSVSVVILDAGRTLIQVIDDGCGLSEEEALLCFERHATSKIASAQDLQKILTFGFRGEALASIAAVAEVTLKTRREGDETGTQVTTSGGSKPVSSPISAPVGANFSVRNLFYNVPARRKFLKSDNVEYRHIVEEFTRIALTRPEIGFSLTHNSKEQFVLKPAKSAKFRIMDLFGRGIAQEIVDMDAQSSILEVKGFVGRPDAARKQLSNQFFFINGRYFRSAYFHKAVMKAYEGFIPEGVTPPYFLFLQADPEIVDVNVHPAKTEIKFEDDSLIFQILYATIKETLGKNSFGADIDFEAAGALDMPAFGKSFDQYREIQAPVTDFDPLYNPFATAGKSFDEPKQENFVKPFEPSSYVSKTEDYGRLFEEKTLPSTQVLILQGRYLAVPVRSGIMMVNAHRAQQRVLYDSFLAALNGNQHITQRSLFPVQVKVGVENKLILDENAALLSSLGFDISPLGDDAIVVNGVPEGYSCQSDDVEKIVIEVLECLSLEGSLLPERLSSQRAERMAKIGAKSYGCPQTPFEAQRLIDALLSSDNAEFTPSGLRILTIIPFEEIEKKFQ